METGGSGSGVVNKSGSNENEEISLNENEDVRMRNVEANGESVQGVSEQEEPNSSQNSDLETESGVSSDEESEDEHPSPLETLYQERGQSMDASYLQILKESFESLSLFGEIELLFKHIQPRNQILIVPFLLFFVEVIPDIGKTLCFVAFWIFYRSVSISNTLLIAEVDKQSKRNLETIAWAGAGLLLMYATFVGVIFIDQQLYLGMVFICPNVNMQNGWTLVWVVAFIDFTAKIFTILCKGLMVALPQEIGPSFQCRGKYYLMIETTSQVYREFLSITPWIYFLVGDMSQDNAVGIIHIVIRIALYAWYKLPGIIGYCKTWMRILEIILKEKHYGTRPTLEELTNSDPNCTICLKGLTNATRLSCSHIFCSECIHKWLMSQHQTCPNCRELIIFYSPHFRNGATSTQIHII